jgi:hypothetical protein
LSTAIGCSGTALRKSARRSVGFVHVVHGVVAGVERRSLPAAVEAGVELLQPGRAGLAAGGGDVGADLPLAALRDLVPGGEDAGGAGAVDVVDVHGALEGVRDPPPTRLRLLAVLLALVGVGGGLPDAGHVPALLCRHVVPPRCSSSSV